MCKSHTKKIGALKLSQQDVGKNCIFRGCVFFFFFFFGESERSKNRKCLFEGIGVIFGEGGKGKKGMGNKEVKKF